MDSEDIKLTVGGEEIDLKRPLFYVASKGHHADIGGIAPGSMPSFSKFLSEEGFQSTSFKLVGNSNE